MSQNHVCLAAAARWSAFQLSSHLYPRPETRRESQDGESAPAVLLVKSSKAAVERGVPVLGTEGHVGVEVLLLERVGFLERLEQLTLARDRLARVGLCWGGGGSGNVQARVDGSIGGQGKGKKGQAHSQLR